MEIKIIQIWLEPSNPLLQVYVRVHLTNGVAGNGVLKRTIYYYIWGIIFTCSTYYRVMLFIFVCLHISHYRVRFILVANRGTTHMAGILYWR